MASIKSLFGREAIFREIGKERDYQDALWGGPDHDDTKETPLDFERYVAEYALGSTERAARHDHRRRMVKAAALAVAAIERFDRLNGEAKAQP